MLLAEELDTQPTSLYRSSKGIWVITNSSGGDDFTQGRGEFITAKPGPTPLGLKWRCFQDGKWPVDESVSVEDFSAAFGEVLLRRGPPMVVTRKCAGGSGHASEPGYSYTSVPASFDCVTSSEFCFNDSPVYCKFTKELLAEMAEALEETLQERSATSVVLEDELDLIDGSAQTEKLKEAVQDELMMASYRVYLTEPWFGLKTYIQVSDAILLFSVCASYGVAAGVYFASVYDKKKMS